MLRQLHKRFEKFHEQLEGRVGRPELSLLEKLADALLDFRTLDEVIDWLDNNSRPDA